MGNLWKQLQKLLKNKQKPTPKPEPKPVPTPEPKPVPTPTPEPVPVPVPTPENVKYPSGHGMMQGGNHNQFLNDTQINNAHLRFLAARERWLYLEPTQGKYDFSIFLRETNKYIKAGKNFLVPVMTGVGCNPSWLNGVAPWDKALLDAYLALHTELEKQTRSPLRVGVWVTGPTISSQEMHFSSNDGSLSQFAGYSPDKMVEAWKYVFDGLNALYGDCAKMFSMSFQSQASYVGPVVDYVKGKVSKEHLAFQFNSLQENTSRLYIKPLLDLGAQGYLIGAEKVQPGHNVGFTEFPELRFIMNYPTDLGFITSDNR